MHVTGDHGNLTSGGRAVAILRDWRLETGPEGARIEAKLQAPNRWLLTFADSYDVALPMGGRTLYYRGVSVEVLGDEVVIQGGKRDG